MLRRLKTIYRKLSSAGSLAAGISQHDEQLAKLNVAVAELMSDPDLSPERREQARRSLETLLVYQAQAMDQADHLRALYESTAVRLAAAESEIADLKSKIGRMESSLNGKGSDGK